MHIIIKMADYDDHVQTIKELNSELESESKVETRDEMTN